MPADVSSEMLDSFLSECLAAGFTRDPERWRSTCEPALRARSNWVRWVDGKLYLAHPHTRTLTAKSMGQPGGTFVLSDFRPPSAEVAAPVQRAVCHQRRLFE